MYVCMYVRMYVCMYVCMYVYMYVCINATTRVVFTTLHVWLLHHSETKQILYENTYACYVLKRTKLAKFVQFNFLLEHH